MFGRRTHDENGDPNNVFGTEVHPSQLNGSNGFVIDGINTSDNSGYSVSRAGDVNGDGIDDLVIGARDADPNGNNSGETYVVFGKKLQMLAISVPVLILPI